LKSHYLLGEGILLGNTMAERTARDKLAVVSNDLQNDQRLFVARAKAEADGIRSIAMLPLLVADDAVGVFALYASEIGFFHEEELKLLTELGADISFAVDHIEKEQKIAESRESLRLLSRKVRETQEVERARIARELHDSIGQSLTAIKLRLAGAAMGGGADADTLEKTLEIISSSIEEVRGMAMDMHPPQLEYLGLKAALQWQMERQVPADGPKVELNIDELPALDPMLQITCFRLVQEAVNNTLKHSDADKIALMIRAEAKKLYLRVLDDGRGFDPAHAKFSGLGMLGMRERVELAGGTLRVRSAPGEGTELNVELPLAS
jgi:two-component system sensor histidine kinase UhpB